MSKTLSGLSLVAAAVLCLAAWSADRAEARPAYMRQFAKTYENLAAPAKKSKCYTCHGKGSKKNRNEYGDAMTEALGAKNVKDKAEIEAAMKSVEPLPSAVEGKTFGDLIAADTLPGTLPE